MYKALPMPACGAAYHEEELVFCQLEAAHIQEHWSRFRNEDDPPEYVRGRIELEERGGSEAMSNAVIFDMNDARKEKFSRISGKIVDLLKAECESPIEAYALMQFIKEGFESLYGIKGSIVYGKDEEAHA